MNNSADLAPDHQVERDGRTFQVRAVKRAEPLCEDLVSGDLMSLVIEILGRGFWHITVAANSRTWKIGVVEELKGGAHPVLFKQQMPAEADPKAEVARLASAVEAGALDQVKARAFGPMTYRSSRSRLPALLRHTPPS